MAHGGHAAAAGLKIEPQQIEGFRAAFCEVAAGQIPQQQRVAELLIDIESPLSAFTLATVRNSSGSPPSATAIQGPCCVRPACGWPARRSRWAAAGIIWR